MVSMCFVLAASAASTTWSRRSASAASSNVARNAAKRSFGRSRMKPDGVGDDHLALLPGKPTRRRERVSSVAKSLSSASTSAPVSVLRSVLLPAFV